MTSLVLAGAPPQELAALVAAKAGRQVAVCIPARNEAATIGPIVAAITEGLVPVGLVDDVVVVDDGSSDTTGPEAAAAGARVVRRGSAPGKGQALRAAAAAATGAGILVFVDGDVTNFTPSFVVDLVAPLLVDPEVMLVKAAYDRPLDGQAGEGGRVTELLARPLLERFFPELACVRQPLGGEFALRRAVLDDVTFADGYGIDVALLIDIWRSYGVRAIAEADLGERIHRNRPLRELRPHSRAVLDAVLERALPRR